MNSLTLAGNGVHLCTLKTQLETITADSGNFTIKAYARFKGISLDRAQAKKLGKCASALCRERNITPGHSRDETFGYVHNYPENILEHIFRDLLT